jgi:hypothetical protein
MSDSQLTKETQLATLNEWIESARKRTYKETDKRRYAKLTYDGSFVIMEPFEAIDWLTDSDERYELSEIWMTDDEHEALPEFTGF